MATVGERIRKLRIAQGFTQARLAEILHVSKAAVCKWESNTNLPKVMELKNMNSPFHVSADYLLGLANRSAIEQLGSEKKLEAMAGYFHQLESPERKQACIDFVISQFNEQEAVKIEAEKIQRALDEPAEAVLDMNIIVDSSLDFQGVDKS